MSTAIVPKNGPVRQLDKPAEPDDNVTEDEVKNAPRLVRRLMGALRDIATLKRRWWPRRIDYEDRLIDDDTGATQFRFPHGFNGRVRFWAVDWTPSGLYQGPPQFDVDRTASGTNTNTLVLLSYWTGTMTLRVEEVG